jgi:hypothetical protein
MSGTAASATMTTGTRKEIGFPTDGERQVSCAHVRRSNGDRVRPRAVKS